MMARSLLFVPGDRPDRFSKATASGADVVILDLEDSVAPHRKADARIAVIDWLINHRTTPCLVRVNPLDSVEIHADIEVIARGRLDGVMLPKAAGMNCVQTLIGLVGADVPPILPITCETPFAIFELGSYKEVAHHLCGLTWGAEDLSTAIGAATARNPDMSFTTPFEVARTFTLLGAHAAAVAAIDTVYPRIADLEGLASYVTRARGDGFTGMLAIHPSQVPVINAGFMPTEAEIVAAQSIVDAFLSNPGAGALQLNGKMIDRPHLRRAEVLLARASA